MTNKLKGRIKQNKYVVVDVESDGPIINYHSMVCFGAVIVNNDLENTPTFFGKTAPISTEFDQKALSVSGYSRKEHEEFPQPMETIQKFYNWTMEHIGNYKRPIMISDNPSYDFSWINFYFHWFIGENPYGWSARRIGDLYGGMKMEGHAKWKNLRNTKHTHHPVDDAKGNAEALLKMIHMGLNL